ncbi:hypothetical protein B0T24DRAFT_302837 [Lasiosphaeria ovina]|uniref:Uncharacterized protein n=1 Tax=Lasiosphaeria ovina TaxID=92902 RepID=A0AAE0K6B5_9PEZI|nr:hypothetical protein B0T24DRAFT_302837 [Lasiosphaeria ovina]
MQYPKIPCGFPSAVIPVRHPPETIECSPTWLAEPMPFGGAQRGKSMFICLPVLLGYRHDRRASIVCTRVSTRSEVLFRPTCCVEAACAIAIWKPGHSRITERGNDRLMGGFGGEMAANANSFQHFSLLRWLVCSYFVAIPFYTWLLRREMALLAPEHKYRPAENTTPKSQSRVSAAAPSPQSHWRTWRAAPSPWGKLGTLPCMPAPAAISDARFVPLLWFCIFWLLLRCVISASLDGQIHPCLDRDDCLSKWLLARRGDVALLFFPFPACVYSAVRPRNVPRL